MTRVDRPTLGTALRILSGVLFTGMIVCVKAVSEAAPLGQIVFFRSVFALIPLLIFLMLRREFPTGLRTKRPLGHLVRSAFGAAAMFTSFATVALLPLAEATLLAQLSPVLTAIIAVLVLSERLTKWRVLGLALGLAGVIVLVWPDLGGGAVDQARLIGIGLGLLTALLTAFALIMVRRLTRTESPGAIAFYFVVASMARGLLTLPWGWALPDARTLMLLVLAGLFGGFAHIAMTVSFSYAEASRLAPFEYVALLWPIIADLLIFRLPLSTSFLFALPLVLAGAAVAALESKQRARNAA
ncbi:EamA domain-containing membrane protein RarD [Yoonia maricola]|uniref:EamA domain-containing membrane protein RarD n=1 Tax=Yoonia maricola TaxID=420999 RepID=A0A2M8W176_9RHOB|nr:DMT family transporter [Yoonia maricola]PJI84669.1 EamA domain-containing membrane protein RarD [Yoonia maricola]